jgi:hypothetical protein
MLKKSLFIIFCREFLNMPFSDLGKQNLTTVSVKSGGSEQG